MQTPGPKNEPIRQVHRLAGAGLAGAALGDAALANTGLGDTAFADAALIRIRIRSVSPAALPKL